MINAISMAQMPQRSFQAQNNKNEVSFGSKAGKWIAIDLAGASICKSISDFGSEISKGIASTTGMQISESLIKWGFYVLGAILIFGAGVNFASHIQQKKERV